MKNIIKLVLVWRLATLVLAGVILSTIGYLFPYPGFEDLIKMGHGIPLIWSWGVFDGVHYLTISRFGYIADYTQAFFPVYPQIVGFISRLLNINALFSGLIVSNIALLMAIVLFWRLLRVDFDRKQSWQTILLFLLFPTSYYLGSVYTESTFLVFVLGSFLAARLKKWWLAGILGAVASATRPLGVFLLPALLAEWWQQKQIKNLQLKTSLVWGKKLKVKDFKRADFGELLWILLIPLGVIMYMSYLQNHFNDPIKFIHSQPAFGADRSDKIVLLYQTIWRYIKMLFTVDVRSLLYFRVVGEFFWSMAFLILGLFSFKYSRLSYSIFAILSYLVPTMTGTFSSMPRYVLVMFSSFIILSIWLSRHRRLRLVWYLISGLLLIVNMSLFLTGRWVA